MNFRSKNTAMLLCFFLGVLGAHWFYLGKQQWGGFYVTAALAPWPVAFWIMMLIPSPALSALALLVAWLVQLGLGLMVLIDFFTLLTLEPARFDLQYNR